MPVNEYSSPVVSTVTFVSPSWHVHGGSAGPGGPIGAHGPLSPKGPSAPGGPDGPPPRGLGGLEDHHLDE